MKPYQKDTVNIIKEYNRNKIKYLDHEDCIKYYVEIISD